MKCLKVTELQTNLGI